MITNTQDTIKKYLVYFYYLLNNTDNCLLI